MLRKLGKEQEEEGVIRPFNTKKAGEMEDGTCPPNKMIEGL